MKILVVTVVLLTLPCIAGTWFLDVEGGMAFPGYNDVQVPNDETGTRFSLADALDIESKPVYRVRAGYMAGRHAFSLFAAPLSLEASGTCPRRSSSPEEPLLKARKWMHSTGSTHTGHLAIPAG